MAKERIVYAVVDTQRLTLYREDGSTIEIPQGDPRVRKIVDQVMPLLQSQSVAEIDLTHLPSAYQDYEKQSSGLVRFFKVAKKAITSLFADDEESVAPVGEFGVDPSIGTNTANPAATQSTKMAAAVDSIMEQAQSVNHPEFVDPSSDKEDAEPSTMIAVVIDKSDPSKRRVIPGVEAIKGHIDYAARLGSTKGVEAFFARLAPVMDKRAHSVEDLLRFMERADLPIADDGCIVAYKILHRDGRDSSTFVDCYTKKVPQRVGSYVCVDESLVDRNRHNECSNGLHIARRGYVSGFNGDVVTLCKIRPEDVITVPHRDANKVRVCGYHILFEMNDYSYNLLKQDKAATSDKGAADLVTKAITGQHAPPMEEVRITGQCGEGVVTSPLDKSGQKIAPKPEMAVVHKALDDGAGHAAVDPKALSQKVAEVKVGPTRKDKAGALLAIVQDTDAAKAHEAAKKLLDFKKQAKVSWSQLGINDAQLKLVNTKANTAPKAAEPAPAPKPSSPPLQATMTRKEQVHQLVVRMHNKHLNKDIRLVAAQELLQLRKTWKVSWASLAQSSLSDEVIEQIITDLSAKKTNTETAAVGKIMAQAEKGAKAKKPEPAPNPMEGLSPTQQEGQKLFDQQNWTGLVEFKRKKKKSWQSLGFTEDQEAEIKLHIGD